MNYTQISFRDEFSKSKHPCPYKSLAHSTENEIIRYYNSINQDKFHMTSNDDICTPMECVKKMIDYIPNELWSKQKIKVLDPCCGNGNFGAYCQFKTNINNIWFNDINKTRIANCKKILNPKHLSSVNFLDMDSYGKWDLIMANPPYSGGGNKNHSLSNEFIEHSIKLLKNNGYLCFVTPNNWMTYNNNNTTLNALLSNGSFIVIDNDVKKYFPRVGSSFTIMIWQKGVFSNKTYIKNNYLVKDEQHDVIIPSDISFIPLYISQTVIDIVNKSIQKANNNFNYRCDLHNFTKKALLSDNKDSQFKYKTIHTARKTRFAKFKQDIYDKWVIIVPLSTYYVPFIQTHVNTTQSVGYFSFDTKANAKKYMDIITHPCYKLIIHLTRYGNFNNIMVLKHLKFDEQIQFTKEESNEINNLISKIKY